jgi:hypothetical protein
MATRKKAEPEEPKPAKQKPEKKPKEAASAEAAPKEDAPQKAAKAVETVIAHPATPPRKKIPKLVKKNKSRLPRKEKKLAKKNLAKTGG